MKLDKRIKLGQNVNTMRRLLPIFFLTAILTACIIPAFANVPEPILINTQKNPVEFAQTNDADQITFEPGKILTPTLHQWSFGYYFYGSFQRGFGVSKALVPPFLSGRIICQNDPVNLYDPDGEFVMTLPIAVGAIFLGAVTTELFFVQNSENPPPEPEIVTDVIDAYDQAEHAKVETELNFAAWVTSKFLSCFRKGKGDGKDGSSTEGDKPKSNPFKGKPGSTSTTEHADGTPKQIRVYGDDGWPDMDIDYDHDHGQGQPHVHKWGRPKDGGPPTHKHRGKGIPYIPA